MTKTVLVAGFEPFNGATINPAWEAVRALASWQGNGFVVELRKLPCVFGLANQKLAKVVREVRPDIVIVVGQAGGRADVTVERVAINIDDASIVDNQQQQPVDTAIVADGPAAYFSTLPIKAIVREMRARGVAASVSQTAGTFVCNHVFYGLMHLVRGLPVRAGFIHVPYLPMQAAEFPGAPSMSLDDICTGLRAAVEVSVALEGDVMEVGGATH